MLKPAELLKNIIKKMKKILYEKKRKIDIMSIKRILKLKDVNLMIRGKR